MTEQQLQRITLLDRKLKEKLLRCEALGDECELLRKLLLERDVQLEKLSSELSELRRRYENQKIAIRLNQTNEGESLAKKEIAAIVQEIDKCIQLLNE